MVVHQTIPQISYAFPNLSGSAILPVAQTPCAASALLAPLMGPYRISMVGSACEQQFLQTPSNHWGEQVTPEWRHSNDAAPSSHIQNAYNRPIAKLPKHQGERR
ncbi:unnamed protein product [Ixodes pacificus]